MSDLAPFVAASLRDKVVSELHQELLALRKQIAASQQVTITGPRGSPIHTRADFRQDGRFDISPELWKVEFDNGNDESSDLEEHNGTSADRSHDSDKRNKNSSHHHCTLSELCEMEVRVGGILKAKWSDTDDTIEGFVNNDFCVGNGGTISLWFGGSSGIWLTIRLIEIDEQSHASLRELDLSGGRNLWSILCSLHHGSSAHIAFTEVSFMISHLNQAMEAWGMPTEPPEED